MQPADTPKKKSRLAEFLEVAQVIAPVRLRDKGYTEAVVFKYPTNDSCSKRRVIDIRIASDEDDVHLIPTAQVGFFLCYREPV